METLVGKQSLWISTMQETDHPNGDAPVVYGQYADS